MKIAVEGCAHGELETIYETINYVEEKEGLEVDLLICCGDFQSSRNEEDLRCMAVPPKFYNMCSFYKYYTGEKKAPILTIFIGGNHEASNYLQELPYGGWVAPNIFYLGYAGVISVAGVRIGGLSGIYKGRDYMKGHFEYSPYDDNTKRSVYHVRNLEVFRLKQIAEPINIFLSHDWPQGVWNYGNKAQLIRFKPFFEKDINSGELGSKPAKELLNYLKPDYWFSAHLHCKFAAVIPHDCGKTTKFLALDKCLPKRRFLQLIDMPHDTNSTVEISYDLEWLTILRLTNHLLSVRNVANYLPGPNSGERYNFTPTQDEKLLTLKKLEDRLIAPQNFEKTAIAYAPHSTFNRILKQSSAVSNPQTVLLCKTLIIDDPLSLITTLNPSNISANSVTESAADLSVDKQTFIEESDVSANTTPRKFILNLPPPVRDSVEFEDKDGSEEEGTTSGISILIDTEGSRAEDSAKPIKKIKRRNAAMYQDDTFDS